MTDGYARYFGYDYCGGFEPAYPCEGCGEIEDECECDNPEQEETE